MQRCPWDNTGPKHSSLDRESLKTSDFVHLRTTLWPYDETLFNYYQNPATTPKGQAGLQGPLVPFRAWGAKGNKDSMDGSVLPAWALELPEKNKKATSWKGDSCDSGCCLGWVWGESEEGLECTGSPLLRHRSLPSWPWPWRGARCWSSGTCYPREDSPARTMHSTPGKLAGGVLPESFSCLGVSSGILSFHDVRGSFVEL